MFARKYASLRCKSVSIFDRLQSPGCYAILNRRSLISITVPSCRCPLRVPMTDLAQRCSSHFAHVRTRASRGTGTRLDAADLGDPMGLLRVPPQDPIVGPWGCRSHGHGMPVTRSWGGPGPPPRGARDPPPGAENDPILGGPRGVKNGPFWGSPEGSKNPHFGPPRRGGPGTPREGVPGPPGPGPGGPKFAPQKPGICLQKANICPDWESY